MFHILGKEVRVDGRLLRIGRVEGELYVSIDDPLALIDGIKCSHPGIDLFTFMQMPPQTEPLYSFPIEWSNVAAVEVSSYEQWMDQIGKKTRNMVRQAEKKGVTLSEVPFDETLVRGIWEIYNEVPIRQGRKFSHYGKDLQTVHRITATFLDRSIFIAAHLENKLIGFVKLTPNENGAQAGLMNIISMVKHRDKSIPNALIAEAVKACAKRKIRYLLYSAFAYGKKGKDSLTEFKEHNGFRRIDLPRYYVPITARGQIALRLGLHRNLETHIPESILARLRDWRMAWHRRRLQVEKPA